MAAPAPYPSNSQDKDTMIAETERGLTRALEIIPPSYFPQSKGLQPSFPKSSEQGRGSDCSQNPLQDRDHISSKLSHLTPRALGFLLQADVVAASTKHLDTLPRPLVPLSTSTATPAEIYHASLATSPPLSTSLSSSLSLPNDVSTTTHLSLNNASPTDYPLLSTAPSCYFPPLSNVASAATCPLPSTETILSSAEKYFREEIGPGVTDSRIRNLRRATKGFIESKCLDPKAFANLFPQSLRSSDGSGLESILRLQRLCRILDEIDHHFVRLLGHIYFAHEVGQIPIPKAVKPERGKGWKTAAISVAAGATTLSKKQVGIWWKKCRNIMLLLKFGGPGSLLRIGTTVNSIWENHLNKDDVEVLLRFRKQHLPSVDDECHKLDPFATQIIFDGMIAYGWSYDDLVATHSDLTDCLRRYKDFDRLARDRHDRLAITRPLSGMGEGSGASGDGLPNKRRYEGSDNTEHSVKRVQLGQPLEERDISRMMQQAETFGYIDIATIMQEAQPFSQFDISMAMQPVQNSGLLISEMMQPAQNFGESEYIRDAAFADVWGGAGYIGVDTACSDVLERFDDAACAATPWPDMCHSNSSRSAAAATHNTKLRAYAQSSESALIESLKHASTG